MGSCASAPNCKRLDRSVAIEVISDIDGIGILVAFLVTSSSALLLIIYAYLKHCLPSDVLTWADLGFLQNWHLCKKCRKRFTAIVESRNPDPDTFCKHTNLYRDTRRRKALGAFLLTLSDQQLVVGPAVIIGALAQRCRLGCYEFQMVRNLAMLASVAHLSTLIALRDYLIANTVVRDIRVVGMLVNLCLLVFTFIIAEASGLVDSSARIQCVMNDLSIFVSYPASFSIALIWTFLLIGQYFSGIIDPYTFEYNETLLRWLCCDPKKKPSLTKSEFEEWYERKIKESVYHPESDARREYYWLRTVDSDCRFPRWYTFVAVLYDYILSFLVNPETLLLSCSYGVAQIIGTKIAPPDITNNTNAIDFGQVVPLCLLVIPVLAGLQAYYDANLAETVNSEDTITRLHVQNSLDPRSIIELLKHERQQKALKALQLAYEPTNITLSTSQNDDTPNVIPASALPNNPNPPQPSAESGNKSEEIELPGIVGFRQRGRKLLVFYSLARAKVYLYIFFVIGTTVSLLAGIGVMFDIYYALPWLCWSIFINGVRISLYLRYLRKSWVMSKDMLTSLEGVPRFRRAEVLEKAISGSSVHEEAGEDSVILTQEPEAIGTSFDSSEGQEMDDLVRNKPALVKRTTWANNALSDLGEVGRGQRRMDTEERIGL